MTLTRALASLALVPLLLAACDDGSSSDDEAGQTQTDTDASTDGTDATEDGTDDGGPYGHGNLHPDCMGDAPVVVMETNMGTITLELDAVLAPISVENFLGYVSAARYDDTVFHRVVDGFVIQGGGFDTDYKYLDTEGTIPLEIHPELRHVDGAIAMARSTDPDTAQRQWYITDGAQGGLDDSYAVFGVMTAGFDVRDAISAVPTGDKDVEIDGDIYAFTDVPVDSVVVEAMYCM